MNIKEDLRLVKDASGLRAVLMGEIDHHCAKRIRERIDTEIFSVKPEVLVLDFSRVRFMDSSGIALIIGRAELCGEFGIGVRLSGLSDNLKKLIRLSGVDKISNIILTNS
jgi:stage II sporulation protein AA (anti-sigma F factor antagonist)